MGEWSILDGLFNDLKTHMPMLGRFWLFLVLVFRIVVLGTVASDMFEDEQEQFLCNTLQPGCNQVCFDMAFPISLYRFWVFHIVLVATPSLLFVIYAAHHSNKLEARLKVSKGEKHESHRLRRLYIINVLFRIVAEIGFLVCQYWLYGFEVKPLFACTRSPCPKIVDCYPSRPTEKTVFLCFYFAVGVISAFSSFVELVYSSKKYHSSSSSSESCSTAPLVSVSSSEEVRRGSRRSSSRGRNGSRDGNSSRDRNGSRDGSSSKKKGQKVTKKTPV